MHPVKRRGDVSWAVQVHKMVEHALTGLQSVAAESSRADIGMPNFCLIKMLGKSDLKLGCRLRCKVNLFISFEHMLP